MSTPHIAFRCDASAVIGSGHVMRCLTLARALVERRARCSFLCRDLPGHMMARIAAEGYTVHTLAAPQGQGNGRTADGDYAAWLGVSPDADAMECRTIVDTIQPDRVVVDHYALDAVWEGATCPNIPVMAIDDLANRPHRCDILLDQNLGRQAGDYDGLVPEGALRLIGPSHALLRPEFAAAREGSLRRRAGLGAPQHVMISMGGMDRDNSTGAILDALAQQAWPEGFRLSVVMGRSAPHLKAVKSRARSMPVATDVLVDVANMAGLLAQTDLAIGAAGGSAWERCCLGVPTLVLTLADNQRPAAYALETQGAALLVGDLRDEGWQGALTQRMARLSSPVALAAAAVAAAAITDGTGADDVAVRLLDRTLTVREVTAADAEAIWEWRNAGDAALMYKNQTVTPFESHLNWLTKAIAAPNRALRMIEKGGEAIGHVRIDQEDVSSLEATVSICISPKIRGQRLARPILIKGLGSTGTTKIHRFLATVHQDNTASIKLFVGAGFREISADGKFVYLALENQVPLVPLQ